MRTARTFFAAITTVVLVAASSVASARVLKTSEEFHKSYSISPSGSVRLSDVNGNVRIKSWSKNEVKVDAVKYADDEDELGRVRIEVDATSDMVDIDTKYPSDNGSSHGNGVKVEYTLTVPADANLKEITTVNGDIDISGVGGQVKASTVNGNLDASDLKSGCELKTVNGEVGAKFFELPSSAKVRLESVNGRIAVHLPASAEADVEARVTTGSISNDFGLVSSSEQHDNSFVKIGDSLHGQIGKGGAELRMNLVNGSIEILKSGK